MGHCLDTYSQVQALGVERLRMIYDELGLSLNPQAETDASNSEEEHLRFLIQTIKAEVKRQLLKERAYASTPTKNIPPPLDGRESSPNPNG